jgi:hypothetical protein
MEEIQNQDIKTSQEPPQEPPPEQPIVEKKERKKKDTTGTFRLYAVVNPFNNEVVVKRFREIEPPIGVVFVKYLEGCPEREKFAEFNDGSSVWTWTTQQKRLEATIAILSRGKVKFLDKDNIKGVTDIIPMELEPEVEKVKREPKPRVKKEQPVEGETPTGGFNMMDPRQDAFEFFSAEEPEATPETTPEELETPPEVPEEKEEIQQFSMRKDAVEYAKTLGYSKKQIEDYVRKIDGFWTVVQS